MSAQPLRRGDVVAIRAVVTHDEKPGENIFTEIGFRSLLVRPDDIHCVIHRHYDVGEVVMIDTLQYPTKVGATVRAIVGQWVICEVEEGMPPVTVAVGNVERCPPETAEIYKALTNPKIVDGPAPPLAPEPAPMPAEDFAEVAPSEAAAAPSGDEVQF